MFSKFSLLAHQRGRHELVTFSNSLSSQGGGGGGGDDDDDLSLSW